MEIMHNYADLVNELETIDLQVMYTNKELENWSPDGRLGKKFGMNASLIQINKRIDSLNRLEHRRGELEEQKEQLETLMNRFNGLDYKIAYHRIVEGKPHKEIADELGYSEQHIKQQWRKIAAVK